MYIATADLTEMATNKKIELTLLVHPEWMKGAPAHRRPAIIWRQRDRYPASTVQWFHQRARISVYWRCAAHCRTTVTCPETGVKFKRAVAHTRSVWTRKQVSEGRIHVRLRRRRNPQPMLTRLRSLRKDSADSTSMSIQGYCPKCDAMDTLQWPIF